jgi:DNA-binding response OmpR family regulator
MNSQAKICPSCGQPIAPTGLCLPPIKQRIFEAVKRRPGITAQQLRDWVWADDLDGGPLTDTKCLHVHVAQLNRLLAPHGIIVRSQGGGYQIRSA